MEQNPKTEGIPAGFLVKSLLFSYILTALLLALLAFLLYKLGLDEKSVSISMIAIYVVCTFFGGFIMGKKTGSRRFRGGEADGEQAVFLGAFDGERLFPGAGGGVSLRGEGEHPSGKLFFYHPGTVRRRRDAGGHGELNFLPGMSVCVRRSRGAEKRHAGVKGIGENEEVRKKELKYRKKGAIICGRQKLARKPLCASV